MVKNVTVIGAGRCYGTTWPKRAAGLVKKGRARYVDENTICLACPPDKNLEDIMDNNIIPANEIKNDAEAAATEEKITLTPEYILEQIEGIRKDSSYLHSVIEKLSRCDDAAIPEELPFSVNAPLGIVTKSEALRDIVRCRETTNQKMIEFYEKIYDDMKTADATNYNRFIIDMIKATNAGAGLPDYTGIIRELGKLFGEKK